MKQNANVASASLTFERNQIKYLNLLLGQQFSKSETAKNSPVKQVQIDLDKKHLNAFCSEKDVLAGASQGGFSLSANLSTYCQIEKEFIRLIKSVCLREEEKT